MADVNGDRLVLASGSVFRRRMLEAAGLAFAVQTADIDERALERELFPGGSSEASAVACALAKAKAARVSGRLPQALVIGCDQVLALDGALLSKAADPEAARQQLVRLRGRMHTLHTAACLVRGGREIWHTIEVPRMTMRNFSDAFLADYAGKMGARLCQTVGAYEIEGQGIQLFERIEGDLFSIIGLPLLPLLAELRRLGALAA